MRRADRGVGAAAVLATALAATLPGPLAGCTSLVGRKSPLPTDGPTVVDVYEMHRRRTGEADPRPSDPVPRLRGPDPGATPAIHARELEPVRQRFARLPNPDLVMYVFPHLSGAGHPVPGYLTVFPMYETVEYALPGEVAPRAVSPSPALPATSARASTASRAASAVASRSAR